MPKKTSPQERLDNNLMRQEYKRLKQLLGQKIEQLANVTGLLTVVLQKTGPVEFSSEELETAGKSIEAKQGNIDLNASPKGYVMRWLPKDSKERDKLIKMGNVGSVRITRVRPNIFSRAWWWMKRLFKRTPRVEAAALPEETKTDGQGEGQEAPTGESTGEGRGAA